MQLVVLGIGILLLLWLIGRLKFGAFLSLVIVSFAVGLMNGMKPLAVLGSVGAGIGSTMGSLALVLVFGAMLGKLVEESGAAQAITLRLTRTLGLKRIQLAVLITGFLVGLPMMYNASFLVLIPLVYAFSEETGLPLLWLGIPLCSALSVTHGFLPPHPAPVTVAAAFGADPNLTLLYGLVLAVPAAVLGGPVLARFHRKAANRPPAELYRHRHFEPGELPGFGVSLAVLLVPVTLMLSGAAARLALPAGNPALEWTGFFSDPAVALFISVLAGMAALGLRRGRTLDGLAKSLASAVEGISGILFIIAAGGAFKQVLMDSGTGEFIRSASEGLRLPPILLAWTTAALLRFAVGSATVAAITAAGIVLPVAAAASSPPELMVIAVTTGSLMFSHFNDVGFWMFKQYYGATVRQTLLVWTVMECLVSVTGLAGVLLLDRLL